MFGTYSCCNIIVLLNMLIAMMSNSYQSISVNNDRSVMREKNIGNLSFGFFLFIIGKTFAIINNDFKVYHMQG